MYGNDRSMVIMFGIGGVKWFDWFLLCAMTATIKREETKRLVVFGGKVEEQKRTIGKCLGLEPPKMPSW